MIQDAADDHFYYKTNGISMWPFLKGTEQLIIKKTAASGLAYGDLVVYWFGEELVCHRLHRKEKNNDGYTLFTRGDVTFGPFEIVHENRLMGRVSGVIKGDKVISFEGVWYKIKKALIMLILPAVNLVRILYENSGIASRRRKNKPETGNAPGDRESNG